MPSESAVITVSELNRQARLAIEKTLPSCWVTGEISNFTQAVSGHWYFTLKDEQSGVRCAFFRNRNQFLDWTPSEGAKVEIRAQATLYEPRGDYQLLVDTMRRGGQGLLYEEFLRLKSKLEAEGLFQTEGKRRPPRFPKNIGIVTSLQAAALQDVLKTLELRWPSCPIIIYPTSVQGSDAAAMISQSLNTAFNRKECEILLIVRGGGSLEDLHPFNDEKLARTIHSSPIPIITGIGHETDFTIADFVADVRAATPTAAAQMAVPDILETGVKTLNLLSRMNQSMERQMHHRMQHLDGLSRRVIHPGNMLAITLKAVTQYRRRFTLSATNKLNQEKQTLINKLTTLYAQRPNLVIRTNDVQKNMGAFQTNLMKLVNNRQWRIEQSSKSLQQLDPNKVLSRGYCIAFDEIGRVIKYSHLLRVGSKVQIQLNHGKLKATVNEIIPTQPEA